jgi:hypothetical protein
MSPRNIAFMRTILHAANQFPAIRHARLQALRAHASRDFSFSSSMKKPEQLVTIFSFLSAGPPTVTVRRLSHVRAQDTMGDIYWDAYAARAAAGVGTIEMQVMMVLDGERQRLRMFTLRSSSPIGHSVESGGEGVVEINC